MVQETNWRDALGALLEVEGVDPDNEPLALEVEGDILVPLRLDSKGEWSQRRASWRDLTSQWVSVTSGLNPTQLSALRLLHEKAASVGVVRISRMTEPAWDALERCVRTGVCVFTNQSRQQCLTMDSVAGIPALDFVVGKNGVSVKVIAVESNLDTAADLDETVFPSRFGVSKPLPPGLRQVMDALAENHSVWVVPQDEVDEFWAAYVPRLTRLEVLAPAAKKLASEHVFGSPELHGTLRYNPANPRQIEIAWQVVRSADGTEVSIALNPEETDIQVSKLLESVASLAGWKSTKSRQFFTQRFPIWELDRLLTLSNTINQSRRAVITISPELADVHIYANDLQLSYTLEDATDKTLPHAPFSLKIGLTLGSETLDTNAFLTALGRMERWWQTPNGSWVDLYASRNQQLKRIVREFGDLGLSDFNRGHDYRIGLNHFELVEQLHDLSTTRELCANWEDAVTALVNPPEIDIPALSNGTWRPYQEDGLRWLNSRANASLGGILADDMGLGKTLQILALISARRQQDTGPVLAVVPSSVIGTWIDQTSHWFPELNTWVVNRSVGKTATDLAGATAKANKVDLIVTTYTLARMDMDFWETVAFSGMVLDEAQFVKNPSTATYKALTRVRSGWCFALTGTPIENSPTDLWAIMSLAVPGVLPELAVFSRRFAAETLSGRSEALRDLNDRVAPFLLRRTKEAVARELPAKIEQVISIEMESEQSRLYERYLLAARREASSTDTVELNVLTALTRLRQLALSAKMLDARSNEDGAKINYLFDILQTLRGDGSQHHQVLVFSQFTSFLALLRSRLDAADINYAYLDGSSRDRDKQIARFQEGAVDIFLISLKAGGFGLNLTAADYVFLTDPWWNPAVENQAVDRAHRLGQKRSVNVYRLVATGTIEERVLALQERKRDLIAQVLSGQEDREVTAGITMEQLRQLLS